MRLTVINCSIGLFSFAKKLLCFCFLLLIFSIYGAAQNNTINKLFGYTPGKFTITDNGSSLYSVPLIVSPGTSGTQPSLSLTYNSQANNGILGIGWTLEGMSVISRSGSTVAQDGQRREVDLSSNDKFALDGECLVLYNNQKYGSNGAEYRTENNNFSKIVSYSSVTARGDSSPLYFRVYTRSGMIMEYGNTVDSRVSLDSSLPLHWLLNKVTDTKGNYYTITYLRPNLLSSEYYPSKIEYTGNANTGLAPYCKININYESRPDTTEGYKQGHKITSFTKRIASIVNTYKDTLVRSYYIQYKTTESNLSIIQSIKECGSDSSCHEATQFDWNEVAKYGSPIEITPHGDKKDAFTYSDFNGDGVMEIVKMPYDSYYLTLYKSNKDTTNPDFFTKVINPIISFDSTKSLAIADFNGDSKSDMLIYSNVYSPTLDYHIYLNQTKVQSDSFSFSQSATKPLGTLSGNPMEFQTIDFNGDGRSDIFMYDLGTGSNKIILSNSVANNLSFESTTYQDRILPLQGILKSQLIFADLNGDGNIDYLLCSEDSGTVDIYSQSSNTLQFTKIKTITFPKNSSANTKSFYMNDMNADGLPDFFIRTNNAISILLNDGNFNFNQYKTLDVSLLGNPFKLSKRLYFADVNQDGFADMYYYYSLNKEGGDGQMQVLMNVSGHDFVAKNEFYLFGNVPEYLGSGNFNSISNSNILFSDLSSQLGLCTPTSLVYTRNCKKLYLYKSNLSYNNIITKITEGGGKSIEIKYDYLTNDSIYSALDEAVYPLMDYKASQLVVSSYKTNNGIGGYSSLNYRYKGAKLLLNGRGFRGFSEIKTINTTNGVAEVKQYKIDENSWKFGGSVLQTNYTLLPNGTVINKTNFDYSNISYCGGKSFFGYVSKNSNYRYEINGTLTDSTLQYQTYDSLGNVIKTVTDYGEGEKDSLVCNYYNDTIRWINGRLSYSKLYRFKPSVATLIRSASFSYDLVSGLLQREISYPDSSLQLQTEKKYIYDSYGNIVYSSLTAYAKNALETHQKITTYDDLGRFTTAVTNELGQSSTSKYSPLLGLPTETTDANGIKTQYYYDGFGRQVYKTFADGNWETYEYIFSSDVPFANSAIITNSSVSKPITKYYDVLNREVMTSITGFDGRIVNQKSVYDVNGYEVAESDPYFSDSTPVYTTKKYDIIGRVTSETRPDGRKDSIQYNGRSITFINAKNQKKTLIRNTKGAAIEVLDNQNNSLKFYYNAAGNLIKTTDPVGNEIINDYDFRGNKTQCKDPDLGTYKYEYDGFGRIIKMIYPSGSNVTYNYDLLNRLTSRIEPEGTSSWTYDNKTKGIGLLGNIVGINGVTKNYEYDSLSRLVKEEKTINGKTYKQQYEYNAESRLSKVIYPNNFAVGYNYNANGYLFEVVDASNSQPFWTANTFNAKGQLEQFTFGNGTKTNYTYDNLSSRLQSISTANFNNINLGALQYRYDDVDNLLQRTDAVLNVNEQFEYDVLNRLTKSKTSRNDSIELRYNVIGNITYKSDVGSYFYGAVNNGPHRLDSVLLIKNICLPSFKVKTDYTSFNKVKTLSKDSAVMQIVYDESHQRVWQQLYVNNNLKKQKFYAFSDFETEIVGNDTIYKSHITVMGHVIATKTFSTASNTIKLNYFHRDNLGSVVMVTNDTGAVLSRYSFDAWGKRRNGDWANTLTDSATLANNRGFTGHEHYDFFDIVDMNGRVYDPLLGRFLSPDPTLQFPTDLQDYNRYTYAINNPLKYTDPSGYGLFKSIRRAVASVARTVVNTAKAIVTNPGELALTIATGGAYANLKLINNLGKQAFGKETWGTIVKVGLGIAAGVATGGVGTVGVWGAIGIGAGIGFTTSATSTLAAGGNLGDALRSGIKGGVIGGVTAGLSFEIGSALKGTDGIVNFGGKVVGHGVVQGISNEMDGGKFINGFVSGSISELSASNLSASGIIPNNSFARMTAAAIMGGTTSSLTGGKFVNGATTSAFFELFSEMGSNANSNDENSNISRSPASLSFDFNSNQKEMIKSAGKIVIGGITLVRTVALISATGTIGLFSGAGLAFGLYYVGKGFYGLIQGANNIQGYIEHKDDDTQKELDNYWKNH